MAARKTRKKAEATVQYVDVANFKETIDATQRALEDETLKAAAKRGVIESDNDWFENWKPEDEDMLKAEKNYLQAYSDYIVARRTLEQARSRLRDAYQKAGLSAMNIISHRIYD